MLRLTKILPSHLVCTVFADNDVFLCTQVKRDGVSYRPQWHYFASSAPVSNTVYYFLVIRSRFNWLAKFQNPSYYPTNSYASRICVGRQKKRTSNLENRGKVNIFV